MDANYINPFLSSIVYTLGQYEIQNIQKGKMFTKDTMSIDKDVTAFVGLTGGITGNISYSFSKATAINIASKMFPFMSISKFDELAISSISELSNVFAGNAAAILSKQNVSVDISTPTLVFGEDMFFLLSSVKTLTINMETPLGEIEVNISLEI